MSCVRFPCLRCLAESDGEDDWDDEMEAAYQQEKKAAYEVSGISIGELIDEFVENE